MKILQINGSPKSGASDTLHISNAFLKGFAQENDEVIHYDVSKMNVNYCIGCFHCWQNNGKCVFDDDVRDFMLNYASADTVIWSFPLYYYGMPAKAKALLERTLPLITHNMVVEDGRTHHPSRVDMSKTRFVLISGSGFPNENDNFEALRRQYELMYGDQLTSILVTESPMFNVKEAEVVTVPYLATVTQAGQELRTNGFVTPQTLEALKTPMIPMEQYVAIVNGNG